MRLRMWMVLGCLLSASLMARAATLTQDVAFSGTAVKNASGAYGITSSSFDLFNTSLGTLTSITIDITGDVTESNGSSYDFAGLFDVALSSDVHTEVLGGSGSNVGNGTFPVSVDGSVTYVPDFEGLGTDALVLGFDLGGGQISTDGTIDGTVTYNYTPAVASTPEPASLMLLGTGLLGLAGFARRRLV